MKKLIIVLILFAETCFSQEMIFNFEKDKIYKINIDGATDFNKADNIARLMEKTKLSLFSYVDFNTSTGYFVVDNFYKVHEIEKMINNQNGYKYLGYEELQLTEDMFLDIYMKRSGYEPAEYPLDEPKKITMGPFNNLTNGLYSKALEIWKNKYLKN